MATRYFIPEQDVIATLPNGNQVIVTHAGQPITMQRAAELGLLNKPNIGPSEIKEQPAEPTAPSRKRA